MSRVIVLPAWLSTLSLASALFVPLGVSLISDTSMDAGNGRNVVYDEKPRFVPPDTWDNAPIEQPRLSHLDHRV